MRPLNPYTVLALPLDGRPPQRFGVMAFSSAEAITTARELCPRCRIQVATLQEDW